MSSNNNASPYLTFAECIRYLRLASGQSGINRLNFLIYKRGLPYVKAGLTGKLFHREAVDKWLQDNAAKPAYSNLPHVKAARERKQKQPA